MGVRAPEDVLALAELLERQAQHVLKHADGRVLLTLPAFLEFLEREPRLVGLVQDLRDESNERWSEYERECLAVLEELRAIWASSKGTLDRVREADADDHGHWAEMGFQQFGNRLQAVPAFEREYTTKQPDPVKEEHFRLTHFVACGFDSWNEVWREDGLEEARARLNVLEDRLVRAWTIRRLRLESEGGTGYAELRRAADELVPGLTDGENGLIVAARNMNTKEIWELIEKHRHSGDVPEAGSALAEFSDVRRFAEVLLLALQSKLAQGRSWAAVVRRYVARCETFDRARLLEVIEAAKASRKVEEVLTLDLARYLFDVGFNPIVDTKIAGLRPDLLDPTLAPGVYVEAKQYVKLSVPALRNNVSQVFDTWARLRNRYDLPEAFLLVFRRGGRLVELPAEIRVRGRCLRLHLVDLAPSSQAGSNARQSPSIARETDLLPSDDPE